MLSQYDLKIFLYHSDNSPELDQNISISSSPLPDSQGDCKIATTKFASTSSGQRKRNPSQAVLLIKSALFLCS